MRFEDVKLNGKYRVTNNETEHGFDVGGRCTDYRN